MLSLFFPNRRARLTGASLVLACLLAACANPALEEAQRLARAGQNEAALAHLQTAADQDRGDGRLRTALIGQRDATVTQLAYLAEAARSGGQVSDMESVLKRLEAAAPDHPRVAWLRTEVGRLKRHQRLVSEAQKAADAGAYERAEAALRTVLTEDPGNGQVRARLARIEELRETQTRQNSNLQLATAQKQITLEFREAALKTVFETLARSADVNFVFDRDVRSDAKVTLFLRNTTVDEAMRVILSTQQLGAKLLNDNTVMVFPATQQKQRDLLDTVTRTFYLVNADPKQAQSLVRTVAKTRDIFIDERLNLLVVRDTPEVVRLIERLIQSIDLPDPEVMMEVEVLEVHNARLNQLGLSWPSSVSFGNVDGTTPITTTTGLRAYVANPLALATLKATQDATNILANPKIRARNREKAKVLLGEKLPVFTTTSTPTNGAISNAVAVTYVDVGLKLDVEPQVQLDNDVTIKVALEVSTITNKVSGPQGSLAYQVGTRQATTTLRLKDGETQILAGLINDTESRSSAGLPYLHELPLLGRLFGVTTDQRDKSEIVLLITPHIVRNVVQPAIAASPVPSGTESQPGSTPLILRDSTTISGLGASDGRATRGAPARSRPNAAAAPSDAMVLGPEEVLPGASFQVAVRNGGSEPLSTTLVVDPSVLDIESPNGQGGRIAVTVAAGGVQSVMIKAKPGQQLTETMVMLESGGEPLRLRVRDAAVPLPSAPAAPAAPAADQGAGNEPDVPVANEPGDR